MSELIDKALVLYTITRDPLTLDAAKLLLRAGDFPLNEPEEMALGLLQRQVAAYESIYTEALL